MHLVMNVEGGPTKSRVRCVCFLQFILLLISFSIQHWSYLNAHNGLHYDCDTSGPHNTIGSILTNIVNMLGLILVYPVAVTYYFSRSIVDPQVKQTWKLISSVYFTSLVYVFVMTEIPDIVAKFLNSDNDQTKITIRLSMQLVQEVLNFIVAYSAKSSKLQDSRNDIFISMPVKLTMALYLRFMQSSLESLELSVLLNLIVSVIEIASRLSFRWRVKLVDKYLKGMSEEDRRIKYSSLRFKRHVGRNRILDMLTEYVCIAIAPLIVMLNWHNGLVVHAGYEGGNYDGWLMFKITLVSIAAEILTDFICWRQEDPHINLRDAWRDLISDGRYWRKFVPHFLFCIILAGAVMLFGFIKFPAYLTSHTCYFVKMCLPHPCNDKCFSLKGPVQATFGNETILFQTSPFLATMCKAIANNETQSFLEKCGFDILDRRH